jgi:hypothetical protein
MMGGLHPRGSLFERPVNIESAKAHHANFRQVWCTCGGGGGLSATHSVAARISTGGPVGSTHSSRPLRRKLGPACSPRRAPPAPPTPRAANFPQVLREHGVRVLTVREILAHGVDEHMGARVQLESMAMAMLKYQVGGHQREREGAAGAGGGGVRPRRRRRSPARLGPL